MPALVADAYGPRHSAANFGCLYTSKALASMLAGPLAGNVLLRRSEQQGTLVYMHTYTYVVILPRQARDKQKETH